MYYILCMPKHNKGNKKKVKQKKIGKKKRRKQNREFNNLFANLNIQKKINFDFDLDKLKI